MFGMRVNIIMENGEKVTLRNVTEIHYNYPGVIRNRIAFESAVHHTGCTYSLDSIKEFETELEVEKMNDF